MTKNRRRRLRKPEPDLIERRRWWRNLPARTPWNDDERDRKLRIRSEFTRTGFTLIVSVLSSSAVWVMQTNSKIAALEAQVAALESRSTDRVSELRREIERLNSYFGVPPPRAR